MQSRKSKYALAIGLLLMAGSTQAFEMEECLKADYQTTVSHAGSFFGLFDSKLSIYKNHCEMSITHKQVYPKTWKIDVCREPVHIKVEQMKSVDVYKKSVPCPNEENDFCEELSNIQQTLQDDGLIFAEGNREDLSTAHGQVFCAYRLVNRYLQEEQVYSLSTGMPEGGQAEQKPIVEPMKEVSPQGSSPLTTPPPSEGSLQLQEEQTSQDSDAEGSF